MNIICVIQARMASTRLPGKVLRMMRGRSTLDRIVIAAEHAKGVNKVVVATSTNKENDQIESACERIKVDCFRGSEDDVLGRYIGLLDKYNPDAVVRITGDCPLADSSVISQVVALYKATGVDYASNTEPPTWPDGLDCEVISARALRAAHEEATRKSDRDCVTRWIVRNRHRFPATNLTCPLPNMVRERWVLDSPEDAQFIEAVFANFDAHWEPNWLDVHGLLERLPKLRNWNSKYRRNERFYEGLSDDMGSKRRFDVSESLFQRTEKLIPFAAQTFSKSHLQFPKGESPLFVSHGDGGYIYDVDGNDYVDFVGALLPNVLGYRDPDVDWAVRQQLDCGASLSLATDLEYQLASLLQKHIPCAEMCKFGKSGSDVTSAAVRLARAIGKDRRQTCILKIKNNYHGWHDWAVDGTSRSAGVEEQLSLTIAGSLPEIETELRSGIYGGVILEPEGWGTYDLTHLRELCTKYGTLLIFDEIITGFRWHLGGYQKYVGVTPDLACFGKAMANGMPISAIVGKAEYMKRFAPPDNIFYSGTFFGETLSIAAAIATINKMERENVIKGFWNKGQNIKDIVTTLIRGASLDHTIELTGDAPLTRIKCAPEIKSIFIKEMSQNGVLIIGSHNLCHAHGHSEITTLLKAWDQTLHAIGVGLLMGTAKNTIAAGSVRA